KALERGSAGIGCYAAFGITVNLFNLVIFERDSSNEITPIVHVFPVVFAAGSAIRRAVKLENQLAGHPHLDETIEKGLLYVFRDSVSVLDDIIFTLLGR